MQSGLWSTTLQIAFFAHGSSRAHGLMQSLFLHAAWFGHSSSLSQPAITGATVEGATTNKETLPLTL